uniref:Uncharacterized protein n=1 Tax=Octactis speculum TaxID=3111310 RepID=A0A7S2GED4_9STRA
MYLGDEGEAKLLNEISTAAAPGSVLILNFMEKPGTSQGKIRELMDQWTDLRFSRFGDATLNFGRYPLDRFPNPSPAFSFLVCRKI